jgi:hypothetical protein
VATALPLSPDLRGLRVTDGQLLAEKVTLGESVFTGIGGSLSAYGNQLVLSNLSFGAAEGTVDGDIALTLPGQLDSLRLNFAGISQQVLTRSLYPDAFTAEGPVSGKVALARNEAGLNVSVDLTPDKPGRLKVARATAAQFLAPAAKAAAQAEGALLPGNFDDILIAQLADYPYQQGHVSLQSAPDGITLTLNYTREPLQPGEPGYAVPMTKDGQVISANLLFQVKELTIHVNTPLEAVLERSAWWRQFVQSVAARPPAVRP